MNPKSLHIIVLLGLWACSSGDRNAEGLRQSCEAGDSTSCLARVASLQRACDRGEMASCYHLGVMYESGEGVAQDVARAVPLYRRACGRANLGCARLEAVPIQETPVYKTPYTIPPRILNGEEAISAMRREYPEHLRRTGVTGTVTVYFYIDTTGTALDFRIDQSSGNEELDQAALRVARAYEFSVARMRFFQVPVWISFPITFE